MSQNSTCMHEPISPELVLVDPDLGARARAALPERPWPALAPRLVRPTIAPAPQRAQTTGRASYPLWARITATLWILVLGILIGGAAVPHAQDDPRVVPAEEDAVICERAQGEGRRALPERPLGPVGAPGSP
jgi:hypothetical protein